MTALVGLIVEEIEILSPTFIASACIVTEIEVAYASVTVTAQDALIDVPSTVAVTTAEPAASAVTVPLLTDTMPAGEADHTIVLFDASVG